MNATAYTSVAADHVQPWVHHSRMASTVTRSHSNRTLLGCSAEGEKGVYSEIRDKIFGKSFCTFRTTKTTTTALPLFWEDWVYLGFFPAVSISHLQILHLFLISDKNFCASYQEAWTHVQLVFPFLQYGDVGLLICWLFSQWKALCCFLIQRAFPRLIVFI